MVSTLDPAADEKAAVARFVQAVQGFRSLRSADFDMKIGIGSRQLLVRVRDAVVEGIDDLATRRPLTSWDFSLSAEPESWQRFWETEPAAGWHDIFALMRFGRMRIEGNLYPFMAHLQFVKDLLASPRSEGRV